MAPPPKRIHIFGGGTISNVRPHLALCAPAFGTTARQLKRLYEAELKDPKWGNMPVLLELTKMADHTSNLATNSDVEKRVTHLVQDPATKIVIMNAALCDFYVHSTTGVRHSDSTALKSYARLSSQHQYELRLDPAPKIINKIRKVRKDIFLVGFKTTHLATRQEMFERGLALMKRSSCNLVVVNDIGTRHNFIITPEEAKYAEGLSREEVLQEVVEMSLLRSQLTFTRSTVVDAEPVPWSSELVPAVLHDVVDYCIVSGAYKTGPTGATVGHFAARIGPNEFLTSRRKVNFNEMEKYGLVRVETDGPDNVLAYGAKPSVGGQSQRIIFEEHDGTDCIVHFHCPLKPDHRDDIPVASQREYECGSHQCGENTSANLGEFGPIKCVMLDKHGPNIVFNSKEVTPRDVIDFINANFDLSAKT